MENLADILQVKIRDTGQTNLEFARNAGIKKKELVDIFAGIAPSKWVMGKICKALDWDYDPEPFKNATYLKNIQLPNRKIVQANFKDKKPKSPLKAEGRFCIRCWFREKEYIYDRIEMCHYTGIRQHSFGKGRGQKGSHILQCPLCTKCHKRFDEPKDRKSVKKSEEFLFYIDLFIVQEFEAGNIIIKNDIRT